MTDTIALEALTETTGCCNQPIVAPRLQDISAKQAAELFKALADPARLQILDVLTQHGREVCVCDLEGIVGLPDEHGQRPKQPTISHHLRVLRGAGLVGYEKRGQWAYYYVHSEQLDAAMALLDRLRS